jgi:preprotein translocase subunit YajC
MNKHALFIAPVLAQKKLTPRQMKQVQNIEKRIKELPPGQRIATINALDAKLKRIRKNMGLARMRHKQAEMEAEIWEDRYSMVLKADGQGTDRPSLRSAMAPSAPASARTIAD